MTHDDTHRGARIGTRIAQIVVQAVIATHRGLLDFKHKLAVTIFNTISNEISDEVDTTIGPILKRMAADYDENGHAQALMHFMAHGRGQFKAIVGSSSTAQSLLWALGTVISNELAPLSYNMIETNPHLVPDPATIAQMVAAQRMSEDEGLYHIRENGYGDSYGRAWIESQKQYPSPPDMMDMVHKGVIDPGSYELWAARQGFPREVADAFFKASDQPVSMQDAALAFLRGAISREDLDTIARKSGFLADAVDTYLQTIGEPPGTQDMLEGYRRGLIDRGTLEKGIKQSRVRNEWIPLIENLRYSPMSTSDAVNAAVQNHVSKSQAEAIADENGLKPGQFETLYETAGAPLSRTELNDLYNRGIIGSDVVIQGLRESRLKDKYGQDAFQLRRRLLEPRTISSAVHNGIIDHATGVKKAMEHGFNAEDAATLVGTASSMKVARFKDRVVAEAETLYVDGGMTRDAVKNVAKSMGYVEQEAEFLTQASDYHREQKVFLTAVNAVRSKLVAHHVTASEASGLLDRIGMPATQRDFLLGFWKVEMAANVRTLTEAQVVKAVKKSLITPEDGLARLVDMGYTVDDAALLLEEI
jgi:hypothetical protein